MASEETYSYSPLPEGQIRLLKASVMDSKPVYELHPCSISDPRQFIALSYAWNTPTRDHILAVRDGYLKITKSVHEALPYLTRHLESEYIWIDGICIDQESDSEKSTQVPLMKDIYTKAKETIIWLGESNDLIDKAIDAIPMLITGLNGFNGRLETLLLDRALVEVGLPTSSSSIWEGFAKLYSRSWFSRLWTFQEAVLPTKVRILCGDKVLSFENLSILTKLLLSTTIWRFFAQDPMLGSIVTVSHSKMTMIAMYRDAEEPYKSQFRNLSVLVQQAREWSASNPADRLYGLLGLCDEEVEVNYRLSPAAIYSAYSRRHLMSDIYLTLLNFASSSVPMRDLPSWCPNFDAPAKTKILGGVGTGYCAGVDQRTLATYRVTSDEKSNTIYTIGFIVDVVNKVVPSSWGKFISLGIPPKPIRSYDFEWEEACLRLSKTVYNEPKDIPRAHWQTLIANKTANCEIYRKDGKRYYALMKVMIASGAGNQDFLESHPGDCADFQAISAADNIALQEYVEAMTPACRKRRFLSTDNGRIGLGPSSTRPGDLICIFYNGETPFVIRPHLQANDTAAYRFIGEAYVDGLMYGEALKAKDRPADRTFALR